MKVVAIGLVEGREVGGDGEVVALGESTGEGGREASSIMMLNTCPSILRRQSYSRCTCSSALGRPAMNVSRMTEESPLAISTSGAWSSSAAMAG